MYSPISLKMSLMRFLACPNNLSGDGGIECPLPKFLMSPRPLGFSPEFNMSSLPNNRPDIFSMPI